MMKERGSFLYLEELCPNFGAKKDVVTVQYLTVFGFLLYSFWLVLSLYVGGLLSFKMSPIIARERP